MSNQLRMYEGAAVSRLTADWRATGSSSDTEVRSSIIRLRNRARQLVRDSGYAKQALRVIRNNVIGRGIQLQAQFTRQQVRNGASRMNTALNQQVESLFRQWSKVGICHTGGTLSYQDIERMALSSAAESGEVFIRIVRQAFGGGQIPLALEIIESDQLDETVDGLNLHYGEQREGSCWKMGIHLDEWQRPIEYCFLSKHPGDTYAQGRPRYHMIIPADDVIHLVLRERPGQTRGVSWLAAAIKENHQLAGYMESLIVRARTSASLMGFVVSPEGVGEELGTTVVDGQHVTDFEPGSIKTLFPGQDITVPDLHAPTGEAEAVVRLMLRSLAVACGVTYESLSADYSTSNYSSSRLARLDERDTWRVLQQWMVQHFSQRVFEEWLDAAVSVGAIKLSGYEAGRQRYFDMVRWVPRGWDWIDPEKEGAAYRDAVRSGHMTQREVVMSRGGDYDQLIDERKAEIEQQEQLGLIFDTNANELARDGDKHPPALVPDAAE